MFGGSPSEVAIDRQFEKRRHEQLALRLYELLQRRMSFAAERSRLQKLVHAGRRYDYRQNYYLYHHCIGSPAIALIVTAVSVAYTYSSAVHGGGAAAVDAVSSMQYNGSWSVQQLVVFVLLVLLFLMLQLLVSAPLQLQHTRLRSLAAAVSSSEALLTALVLLLWIALEGYLLIGVGIPTAAAHLYTAPVRLAVLRLSLLITLTLETLWWRIKRCIFDKRRVSGGVDVAGSGGAAALKAQQSPTSAPLVACFEAMVHHVQLLLAASLLIEVSALGDIFSMRNLPAEQSGAAIVIVTAASTALVRCLALRAVAHNQQLQTEDHHFVLAASALIGFVLVLLVVAAVFGVDSILSSVWAPQLLWSASSAAVATSASLCALTVQLVLRLLLFSDAGFALQILSALCSFALYAAQTHAVIFKRVAAFNLFAMALLCLSWESWWVINIDAGKTPLPQRTAKHMEDTLRSSVGMAMYHCIVRPCQAILSLMLPQGIKLWTYPGPVAEMGPAVEYGMAYQVRSAPAQQREPTAFVCNVGHIGNSTYDYARTASSTASMLKDFIDDPDIGEKGFVSDLVAVFPQTAAGAWGSGVREVNFSGWESAAAAREWFKRSEVHRSIVKEYHDGALDQFSAMLAALQPAKHIEWGVRCRFCAHMNNLTAAATPPAAADRAASETAAKSKCSQCHMPMPSSSYM